MKLDQHTNIRVLHIINGEHYSGGERVQDILGLTLPEYGYDVGFACLVPDLFPKVYRAKNSPIYALPMKHRADISPLITLREIIRSDKYKLIHSHMPRTALLAKLASLLEHIPMVHHIHCPTLFDSPQLFKNIVSASLERISLIGASAVIPCSQGMKQYARSIRVNEKRISVVLNGIPLINYPKDKRPPKEIWVFGMVALFRPRKGLEFLLNAIKSLKDKRLLFKFRAIGDFMSEEYRIQILNLVDQLDIADLIEWVGFSDDVPQELRKLDFFVLPSTGGEGLPIAILEAMATQLPVITTNIPGNEEVIRHGIEGYLCNPESSVSLSKFLEKMMSDHDNWQKMSMNAYNRQRECFSDKSMALGVAQIYDKILNVSRSTSN
jgi:glycosyltransferase involved in cell wall biosynthesis